ncbi:hypothetical protein EVG20_g4413 [Dentipellis fragilis]|uniref:PFU domain-containing protein n=1 Tax=Dentipellis fragilis TaxID=205917 RepID=A0A4Y9YW68_9AGAM|nr:hypothetical protein EVG20_g4413 [Dentipellis fragilis]
MPFKLAATLASHSSDVRAVASPTNDLILSASRDSTAIAWIKSPESSFQPAAVFRPSPRFVNAVTYLPPTPDAPQGYAVTGGQDAVINVWVIGASSDEPKYSLIGHSDNVCALKGRADGVIVSGSWDRTAKIWRDFQLAHDLTGHTQSVWAVLDVQDDQFLTGSADKTIKLWRQHKCLRTYHGHKDAVRSLVLLTDIGFASASNDRPVDFSRSASGHLKVTSSTHSAATPPSSTPWPRSRAATSCRAAKTAPSASGEVTRPSSLARPSAHTGRGPHHTDTDADRPPADGECSQTIVHPAISVWSISTMPNGDIVSGCSDGVVRIFSEVEARWASAEELKAYDDQVASQALPAQQVGDVKKSDLPGTDALSTPGKKPGEVRMVRNGTIVEAHQWDAASGSWQKIGEVVDAVGSGRKQLHEGKEYDYVFDVDIQDGVPPLKLPYNANENPYGAAQRFLEANELPMNYVDQVVQFIEKNSAGVNIGGGEEYADPFTGASRYRGAPSTGNAGGADPFTGGSRYTPMAATLAPTSAGVGAGSDPFTGASRYTSSSPPVQPMASPVPHTAVIPVSKPLSFKQANVSAMQGKLYQFDDALRNEISTSELALYPEETKQLEELFQYLHEAVAGRAPQVALTRSHIETVVQILTRWPASQRFPVLDLARLISGYCSTLLDASGMRGAFFDALFKASDWTKDMSNSMTTARETNVLLALRTFANAFQEKTRIGDSAWVAQIFADFTSSVYATANKAQRLAFATLLFNISCVTLNEHIDQSLRSTHVSLLQQLTLHTPHPPRPAPAQVLTLEKNDAETVYRALVGAGNVLYAAKSQSYPLDAAQLSELRASISALPALFADARIRPVSGEVLALL